jgi:hypothetical protein
MASVSADLKIVNLAYGEEGYGDFNNYGDVQDANQAIFENALTGISNITVTSSDVTLTDTQHVSLYLNLSGTLTGNRSVLLKDNQKGFWIVKNACTGAYSITVKPATGTGVVVAQGARAVIYSNGTAASLVSVSNTLSDDIAALAIGAANKVLTSNGTNIVLQTPPGGVDYQEFTESDDWVKASNATVLIAEVQGAGAGGASGEATGNGVLARGGGGGGGGANVWHIFSADDVADTCPVVVGDAGVGGNPGDGTDGGVSYFQYQPNKYLAAAGGLHGGNTSANPHTPGAGGSPFGITQSTAPYDMRGGSASNTEPSFMGGTNGGTGNNSTQGQNGPNSIKGGAGGAGGGGVDTSNLARDGGNGGGRSLGILSSAKTGAGGEFNSGAAGSDGSEPGDGGGGGAGNPAGSGYAGGDGAPGGGGGGGGGCRTGAGRTPGRGGDGGPGYVRIWTWFAGEAA